MSDKAEREKIAREVAMWHGQKIVTRIDGETKTIAALYGYGSWGHSATLYADDKWREYDAVADYILEREKSLKEKQ